MRKDISLHMLTEAMVKYAEEKGVPTWDVRIMLWQDGSYDLYLDDEIQRGDANTTYIEGWIEKWAPHVDGEASDNPSPPWDTARLKALFRDMAEVSAKYGFPLTVDGLRGRFAGSGWWNVETFESEGFPTGAVLERLNAEHLEREARYQQYLELRKEFGNDAEGEG